ncbi:hypothetical protein V7654_15400 [Bacillus sp. JJ1609]|uniref:hypothetical protein n=1 Tax=Bacillus sp. JJ1609 TaxID=3122977 RepID=UPI002FFF5735
MDKNILYFKDNFFSAGRTDIYNEAKEIVGELDLRSAFSSGIDVLNSNGELMISGKFPMLGIKWRIYDSQGNELGSLGSKFSLFSKKFEYDAYGRGVFTITSEAFSNEYEILEGDVAVARFEWFSGFFASPAYQLKNDTDLLSNEELIAVVMGVNAIQKRQRNNAGS